MKDSQEHFDFFRLNELLEGLFSGAMLVELPHTALCLRHPRNIWERFGGAMAELNFDNLDGMLRAISDIG